MLTYMIDFSFLIDIFISFRTVIIDNKGNEEDRPIEIAKHYLSSNFVIDVLATVPFEIFLSDSN